MRHATSRLHQPVDVSILTLARLTVATLAIFTPAFRIRIHGSGAGPTNSVFHAAYSRSRETSRCTGGHTTGRAKESLPQLPNVAAVALRTRDETITASAAAATTAATSTAVSACTEGVWPQLLFCKCIDYAQEILGSTSDVVNIDTMVNTRRNLRFTCAAAVASSPSRDVSADDSN